MYSARQTAGGAANLHLDDAKDRLASLGRPSRPDANVLERTHTAHEFASLVQAGFSAAKRLRVRVLLLDVSLCPGAWDLWGLWGPRAAAGRFPVNEASATAWREAGNQPSDAGGAAALAIQYASLAN